MRKRTFYFDWDFGIFVRERRILLNIPGDVAVKIILAVLKIMKARIIRVEQNYGSISAYRGWKLLSDGELLTIGINPSATDQGIVIDVRSESVSPTFWDWGINKRNLDTFEKLVIQKTVDIVG